MRHILALALLMLAAAAHAQPPDPPPPPKEAEAPAKPAAPVTEEPTQPAPKAEAPSEPIPAPGEASADDEGAEEEEEADPGRLKEAPAGAEKSAEDGTSDKDPIGKCVRKNAAGEPIVKADPKKLSAIDLELSRERRELEKAIRRYVHAAKDFRFEVRTVLSESIEQRRRILRERYGRILGEAGNLEDAARDGAIAKFESFIAKYPRDRKHTSDAMHRLAELYYEKSEIDYMNDDDTYVKGLGLYERGKLAEQPKEPLKSYRNSERIWRKLLKTFPKYRYADGVHYLLGYVLHAQGESDEAMKVWTELVKKFPKSKSAPEVILRIGEMHFDNGDFERAGEVYKQALAYKKSSYYDKAIYKLAWTYMQQDMYDPAIKNFIKLIDFYENDPDGNTVGGALRDEAIEYLGSSLADDDWDGDGVVDEQRGLTRALAYLNTNKPYELEILEEYANTLYKEHDPDHYTQALEVYRLLIDRSKNSPKALDYQLQIIRTYDGLNDIEKRTASRRELSERFHRGSEWYMANRDNPEVVEKADHQVAIHQEKYPAIYHQHAQALKLQAQRDNNPELLAKAKGYYALAGQGYGEYLKHFPKSKLAERFRFFQADAYYYSDQFLRAAETFLMVVANPKSKEFRDRAGHSAIVTYEKLIEAEVKAGTLDPRADPKGKHKLSELTDEELKEAGTKRVTVEKIPIPDLVQKWVDAVDLFVDGDLLYQGKREKQMELAYLAGSMSFRYQDLEAARKRFIKLLACYPKSEFAASAATSIIDTYQRENDFESVEKWANVIESRQLGDPESLAATRKRLKIFKLGVRAKRAAQLYKEEKYLEAAKEFERLADEQPDDPDADKFYFNSARSYQKLKYYDSASGIFEKLVTDPRYKNSGFAEESLLALAENYRLFFYFDKAIDAYMAYFNRYPKSDDRAFVLGRAAKLQLDNGESREAAQTYEQYSRTFAGTAEASNALYQAGLLYEKLEDRAEQRRIWELFVERHKSTPGLDSKVLSAMLRLGKIAEIRGRVTKGRKYYRDIITQYNARALQPGTSSALVAAEASFQLIEPDYNRFRKIKLEGGINKQKAALKRKVKMLLDLNQRYKDLWAFKSNSWTICSILRQGHLVKGIQVTLATAPEPKGLSDDEMGRYLDRRDTQLSKYENSAITRYAKASDKAKELNVTHRCARQALEAIHGYRPTQYPLFKEEKQKLQYIPILSVGNKPVEVKP